MKYACTWYISYHIIFRIDPNQTIFYRNYHHVLVPSIHAYYYHIQYVRCLYLQTNISLSPSLLSLLLHLSTLIDYISISAVLMSVLEVQPCVLRLSFWILFAFVLFCYDLHPNSLYHQLDLIISQLSTGIARYKFKTLGLSTYLQTSILLMRYLHIFDSIGYSHRQYICRTFFLFSDLISYNNSYRQLNSVWKVLTLFH
jgi:hypothetical protein